MTQNHINMMSIIVDKMANGEKFSKSLAAVYTNRSARIPYREEYDTELIEYLGLPRRASNALLRARLRTFGDIISFCDEKKITDLPGVGAGLGIEIFEAILDYCWTHMSLEEQTDFLIDTVERNSDYIRAEIAL